MEEKVDRSDLVFGRHPVVAALKAGQVNKLWILRGPGGPAINELVQLARELRVVFQWVDRRRMAALAPGAVHQGVVARTSSYSYKTLDDLWALGRPDPILVLDGITDPHNLGAILRNAAFFGAGGVIVPRWRSAGLTGAAAKAAAGTLGLVPVVQVANTAQTLLELKEKGYWVYGADAGGVPCQKSPATRPTALVIGAEGEGLHRLVRERCDHILAIPGAGGVASLNASCAAAVLLYELFRPGGSGGFT